MKQKATLILGGGSALGLAHIGAIEILEQQYDICGIVGTSMGAIVGALYACGLTCSEILELACRISNARVFSPLSLDRRIQGIFDGKYLLKLLGEWTDNRSIESGRIPFMAIAYDLISRRTVIINRGRYADAMRASSSLPLIFAPYAYGAHLFVDGGTEYPLPVGFAGLIESELVIAVNVLPYIETEAKYINLEAIAKSHPKRVGRMEVVVSSVFQNQAFLAMRDIHSYAPDLVIDAAMPSARPFAFHKAKEFHRYGKQQTEAILKQYREPRFIRSMRRHYRNLMSRKICLP